MRRHAARVPRERKVRSVQSHHLPDSQMPAMPGAGWLGYAAQHPSLVQALSWLVWLLAVAAFAIWAHLHYHAPAEPRWIGLTIRTVVFAIWAQIGREWLMIYLRHRTRRQSNTGT
jgi:hypothetical protein